MSDSESDTEQMSRQANDVSAPVRMKSVDLGDQNELDYEEDEENEVKMIKIKEEYPSIGYLA